MTDSEPDFPIAPRDVVEKRGPTVGYCIYCGEVEPPLSEEYVVALSLGGATVLPEAICQACKAITSSVEMTITRTRLGPYSVRTGLPTRWAEERSSALPLEPLNKAGTRRTIDLPPDQHAGMLLLLDLPEPTIVVPSLDSPRRSLQYFVVLPDESVSALAHKSDAVGLRRGRVDLRSFYLTLAQVCHAGAFAYPGDWTRFWEPLLPSLIVGDEEEYDRLIGGASVDDFQGTDEGHPTRYRIVTAAGELYLVAYLRVGAGDHALTYQVVVGKRRENVPLDVSVGPESLESLALDPEQLRWLDERIQRK